MISFKPLYQAFKSRINHPPIKGECLYKNPNWNAYPGFIGYHSTRLSSIRDQILQGKFDNQDKDIFISPFQSYAARFQGTRDDSVLVLVSSKKSPSIHPYYKTIYFKAGPHQQVDILGVWKISESWKHSVTHSSARPAEDNTLLGKISAIARNFFKS